MAAENCLSSASFRDVTVTQMGFMEVADYSLSYLTLDVKMCHSDLRVTVLVLLRSQHEIEE